VRGAGLLVALGPLALAAGAAGAQVDGVAERYRGLGRSLAQQASGCMEWALEIAARDAMLSAEADYPFGSRVRELALQRQCDRFCEQAQRQYEICVAAWRASTGQAGPALTCEAFRSGFEQGIAEEMEKFCADADEMEECLELARGLFCAPLVPVP
jgi:hypothetical protein